VNPTVHFTLAGTAFSLPSYGTLLALAAVVCVASTVAVARACGVRMWRAAAWAAVLAVAALVGARLGHALVAPGTYAGPGAVATLLAPQATGFALFGGLAACALAAPLAARALRVPLWTMLDATAAPLGVAVALAKLGCLLNGCCYGTACPTWAAALGVHYPAGSGPALASGSGAAAGAALSGGSGIFGAVAAVATPSPALAPTQLFEAAGALCAAAFATWLLSRHGALASRGTRTIFTAWRPTWRAPAGVAFLAAATILTAARWAVLPLRAVPLGWAPAAATTWYPVAYATILLTCGALMAFRLWRPARAEAVTLDVLPQVR
jgi:prolipoprotein diacylglyceryltransferase